MASALQYLDDVLSPEVRSLLGDQMAKRRAAQEMVIADASAPSPTQVNGGEGAAPPLAPPMPTGPKAWLDRRMAEAHPGWKVDQMLRDQGVGLGGRLWGAINPDFAARKLREASPATAPNAQPGPIGAAMPTPQAALLQRGPYTPPAHPNRYRA